MSDIAEDVNEVLWDLGELVRGQGDEGVERLLAQAEVLVEQLQPARGRVATMSAAELAELMTVQEELSNLLLRAYSYASLRFAANMQAPELGALLQGTQERMAGLSAQVLFFGLEWRGRPDALALLDDPALARWRHHLRTELAYRPHQLSEAEERLLTQKSVTGAGAFVRLFNQLVSEVTVELPGQPAPVPLMAAMPLMESPDRELRRAAAQAITEALRPGLGTRTFIINTLAADKATNDRLREFPTWLSDRNLSNEASDSSVQALVQAVRGRYDLAQRWYRLKARLLGIDTLQDYDRAAPLSDSTVSVSWDEGRELVLKAYTAFSPELGAVAKRFFDERWIDAPVRPGKAPGAFCAYTSADAHPYLLLNWTGSQRDVMVLAHELGHGLHAMQSRGQGPLQQSTPLTLAETASVFGETLTLDHLLSTTTDPARRLDLLAQSVDGAVATVFRQVAMNRFEHGLHTLRREQGELSSDQINALWRESQGEMMGDSVELTEGYDSWWSYVPHFIGAPGYVYAYAYGQLFALAVYSKFKQQGQEFVPRYLEVLAAGGSLPPEALGAMVDCDLSDPAFWDGGLSLIEQQIEAAEQAAAQAGRLEGD